MSFYQTSYSLPNFSVQPRGKLQAPYGSIQHYPASAELTGNLTLSDAPANFMLIASGAWLYAAAPAITVTIPVYAGNEAFHEQLWEFLASNKRNVQDGDWFIIEIVNMSSAGDVTVTQGETDRVIAYGTCGCVALQCTVTNQQGGAATHEFTLL
jgi:hypothetical protein